MHRTLQRSLFILTATISPAMAQQPAAPAAPYAPPVVENFQPKALLDHMDLKDGDTVVFLGDSITHQCLYTQYVEDFYYTRYPKLHLHFHNAGVGGDRAQDALDRFDDDVAKFKPKYVTMLLGMNDGGYTRYEQAIFDTYQRGMTTLLDKITDLGAAPIPMTPTMFDSLTTRIGKRPDIIKETYYNGVLSLYGSWLREQATLRGLGFVDMWGPMNDLTFTQRKKDPKWSFLPDSVHPNAIGQAVMAEAIIHDVVPHTVLSSLVVEQLPGGPKVTATRGVAGNLVKEADHVTFDFTAESLPWVLPADGQEGYKLINAGHHDSNERLTVRDLPAGRYDLKIDGQTVGTYNSGQFAFGVELEQNDKTPQYQQALKVANLNQDRTNNVVRPLRDLWRDVKIKRRETAKLKADKPDQAAGAQAAFDKFYAEITPKIDAKVAEARRLEDEIYKENQPQARHYEIVRAAAPAPAAKPTAAK